MSLQNRIDKLHDLMDQLQFAVLNAESYAKDEKVQHETLKMGFVNARIIDELKQVDKTDMDRSMINKEIQKYQNLLELFHYIGSSA